jgi:hypothetical protein
MLPNSASRSRGGLTSKIHAVVDAYGLPVCLGWREAKAHEIAFARFF